MNQAVFYVTPISRANWVEGMPLRCEAVSQAAANHLRSGSLLFSKIVPFRTENSLRQSAHLHLSFFLRW